MMKRFLIILVIALLLFSPTAHADVVMGNEFFYRVNTKTEPVNRSFYANGPNGSVSVKEAPGSIKELYVYENGSTVRIGSVYLHRGKYWGIPPLDHGSWNPGWVLMDELLMFYDNIDFEAEHKNELYNYTGSFGKLLNAEAFYIWPWPGSDLVKQYYNYGYDYFDADAFKARHAYLDDEGREWVYIIIWDGLSYGLSRAGSTAGWVCLDDLNNLQIPMFNPSPEPLLWSPVKLPDWLGLSAASSNDTSKDRTNMTWIIIALAVILGMIVMIRVLGKQKNQNRNSRKNYKI